ncbi:MAG: hypothetical protein QF449_09780 [Alphaproteobacteria bacterium]|jgi:uncharacterized protein|nr:hypothetical protein [Alphaproteobacteria bacterium]MDP6590056.1 hypothetical protein [Alphaproteobacteria bacterium]MDP6818311.1 hypothetical protein [Alphaproteobacteria bacterium]|tara:strand:+ start:369 stop:590 length:222 start_codon:yes stop_codon:yes gene_type:complete
MFGFSLPKLLVLIALIVVVWYGFKALGRVNRKRQAQAKQAARDEATQIASEDMIKCPKCGAYTASLDSHTCEV